MRSVAFLTHFIAVVLVSGAPWHLSFTHRVCGPPLVSTSLFLTIVIGFRVFATARSINSIKDLADLGMTALQLDVTNNDTVLRVRDQVTEMTGGKLDVLVNNAYVFSFL